MTRRLSFRTRERLAGYLFVLPDALGLLVFVGVPMLLALGLGFFDVDGFGGYTFSGLANYRRMWADPLFWQSLQGDAELCRRCWCRRSTSRGWGWRCWCSGPTPSTACCARSSSCRRW